MRKLDGIAKRSIGAFGGVMVLAAGIVLGSAVRVIAAQEESYQISAGSVVFDNTYTCLEVEQDGHVKRSWNSEYMLEDGGNRYALGKKTVGYSTTTNQAQIYGGGYLFKEDGTVTSLGRYYEVGNLNDTVFVKLDDSKFMICGESIVSDDGSLDTEKYVYITLDKAGNARLMNHFVNVKVLGDNLISSGNLQLNLAENTLEFGGNYLELDKVRGYIGKGGEVYDLFIRGGNGGNGGIGGTGGIGGMGGTGGTGGIGGTGGMGGEGGEGGMGGIGGIGGIGGMGGIGGEGGPGGIGGIGGGGGGASGSGVSDEMLELMTDMYIRRADSTSNTITCRFNIYDPFNYMGAVEFLIWEGDSSKDLETLDSSEIMNMERMSAAAGDTELIFNDLNKNTEYTISMGYMNSEGSYEERDRITTQTKNYKCSVQITEVREDSFKYLIHLDPEMENISQVRVYSEKIGSDLEATMIADNANRQILLLMSDSGWEGSYSSTKNEMSVLDELDVSVRVRYKNSKEEVVASVLVGNPFYTGTGGSAVTQSIEELQAEVEYLKGKINALSNNTGSNNSSSAKQESSKEEQKETSKKPDSSEKEEKPSEKEEEPSEKEEESSKKEDETSEKEPEEKKDSSTNSKEPEQEERE